MVQPIGQNNFEQRDRTPLSNKLLFVSIVGLAFNAFYFYKTEEAKIRGDVAAMHDAAETAKIYNVVAKMLGLATLVQAWRERPREPVQAYAQILPPAGPPAWVEDQA